MHRPVREVGKEAVMCHVIVPKPVLSNEESYANTACGKEAPATPWKACVPLAWSVKVFVVAGFDPWPSKLSALARGRLKAFPRCAVSHLLEA